MEISKDGTQIRYISHQDWRDIDPTTGLVKLDEGLYFHFKESETGVVCSVRTKRWWGPETLYSEPFPYTSVGPDRLMEMAVYVEHYFVGSIQHMRYKARKVRKDKTQAKYMGSYDKRNVNEVG